MLTDLQCKGKLVLTLRNLIRDWDTDKNEGSYSFLSLRAALQNSPPNGLGLSAEDTDCVIRYTASHGFSYCLDPIISCRDHISGDDPIFPDIDVCYWGIDQLISRLYSVIPSYLV